MSSNSLINTTVTIDGNVYGVLQGTYIRRWTRSFSSNLAANIIRLNFVDRGPGIRVYSFQVMAYNWLPTSKPFIGGATPNFDAQRANLEASYSKIATPIAFLDMFGEPPLFSGNATAPISSGAGSISINSGLSSLLSSPPTGSGGYPYPVYIWAIGTSLGQALATGSGVEIASVVGISGNTLSISRSSPQNWASGVNVASPIGVYFTNLNQLEAPDATSQSPRVIYEVELTEATQVVA